MQKIVPHFWYDKEAKEAAMFYISLFDDSKLLNVRSLGKTPTGDDAEYVSFELAGQRFDAISAGPYFKLNPTISLFVACSSIEELNTRWNALIDGGSEFMPLGEYPFSKRYGWGQDRFGLSWQLMLMDEEQTVQKITPNFRFSSEVCGKAEEAMRYYAEIFEDSSIGSISRYQEGEATSLKAKVNYADFKLSGLHFSAMDHAFGGVSTFNEAFSFIINCKNQDEIDYFWDKLSKVPEAEQCGWAKDQFGVSWQIVPENMDEVMFKGSKEEIKRVTEVLYKMKKIEIAALEKARLEI
ncbi:VOC family protein [Neobacillus notoginsengisoli]|uniref:VOC family protein n=1 Tax=Neobacillus notoginsengisoli TaxID=1578198 RepID=A0A417YWL3_9BACI|nr:VOC family protein [Neobacillus notoginsengisoli]RHW41973.1 VOC family protein [Neobacillus notoginsengisoli]